MLDDCFFYSLQPLEVVFYIPILYPLSLVCKHVVDGWFWWMVQGHGDLRRAEHGNHMKPSAKKLARPPSLASNSDDPITQRLCMTCPPTTLDPNAN